VIFTQSFSSQSHGTTFDDTNSELRNIYFAKENELKVKAGSRNQFVSFLEDE
jgi:hypothetical protein